MPDRTVSALADRFWDLRAAQNPLSASVFGDHRFDTELPDLSREGTEAYARSLRALLADLDALDGNALDGEDRISVEVLRFEAGGEVGLTEAGYEEFTVDPQMLGPHAQLFAAAAQLTLPEPEHADALLVRYQKIGTYLDQACERLRLGVAEGRTPLARSVGQVIRQLDELLAAPLAQDPLLQPEPPPAWDGATADSWRSRLADTVERVGRPALRRYRASLADEVAEHARPPERSGLCAIPGGRELYGDAARWHTSTDLDAERIHQVGLDAIAQLADEYRQLGGDVLGTTDLAEIFRRLRDDQALRFATGDEVFAQAEAALARAQAAVPDWFGRLPDTPCVVREMPSYEVRDGTIAYYSQPAMDGTRPGAYYVNTYAPETRTRFESEALAFHEAVPGHHTQIALAQELVELPLFRRHATSTAYVEGWALYTERLADEMGLYSGDVERLGMLSFDSWRAGRLVVDTGLHAQGWSRDQAVAYLRGNSPLALNNIDNEVDRYCTWPGQALAYKVGQRELLRLRDHAKARLGIAFDIKAFHDAVLGHGPLPLATLASTVESWITGHGGSAR